MIPRSHRFHGSKSLRHVFQKGQAVRGPFFSIRYALNPGRDSFRLAVVVSRKVNKSAVARNRIRRRLYAVSKELTRDIAQPYDIVITVFSDSLLNESATSLTSELHRQLKQAGVLARRMS